MVVTEVTAFGLKRRMHLPVMDYDNKAIASPDAFAVNTAVMRCVAKNISINFGVGQSIYVGDDIPLPALNTLALSVAISELETEKVLASKAAIKAGTLVVNSEKVAEALIASNAISAPQAGPSEEHILARLDELAEEGKQVNLVGFMRSISTFDSGSQTRLMKIAVSKGVMSNPNSGATH
jgi:hypothetical protein